LFYRRNANCYNYIALIKLHQLKFYKTPVLFNSSFQIEQIAYSSIFIDNYTYIIRNIAYIIHPSPTSRNAIVLYNYYNS